MILVVQPRKEPLKSQMDLFGACPCDCSERVLDIGMLVESSLNESIVLRQDAAKELLDYLSKWSPSTRCACPDSYNLVEMRAASEFVRHLLNDKTFHPIKRGYFLSQFYNFLSKKYLPKE